MYNDDKKIELKSLYSVRSIFGYAVLAIMLVAIFVVRSSNYLGEYYAIHIYPFIAKPLSWISSFFPFSLTEIVSILLIFTAIVYIVTIIFGYRHRLVQTVYFLKFLIKLYIWFYIAWGLNYFRDDFYTRTGVQKAEYSSQEFKQFADTFALRLNQSYTPYSLIDKAAVVRDINLAYESLDERYSIKTGIAEPWEHLEPKESLMSSLMSKVAIAGYMNPMFIEINLNKDLSAVEFPFSYAHEAAHALGITDEGEANLLAFMACTSSEMPEVRYSGYFGVLRYVLSDAKKNSTSDQEFAEYIKTIDSEIIDQYRENIKKWTERYNKKMGEIQSKAYDKYLKSNNIKSGINNYSQVVELMISMQRL